MKAVISGYYGFGNTGDEAIALAMTRELKKQGVTPILLSNTPKQSARLYDCESVARVGVLPLIGAIWGADMLLSGGGGLLQDKTSARTLTYYLGLIWLAKMLRKRVVVFNQSIGPLSPAGQRKVASTLGGVEIIVRDRGSLDTLRQMGLSATLGGDPALLLEPSPGITSQQHTVVIAPRGDVTEALPGLRRVVTKLRDQGRRIVALSFMSDQDDAAARSLAADEVISTRDPQVALDTIAASGYVVGVRLHALILAAATHTPFVGIAYDPKVEGFCRDAGAPIQPIKPDVEKLTQLVYTRALPDWSEIEDMKLRAMQSFSRIANDRNQY